MKTNPNITLEDIEKRILELGREKRENCRGCGLGYHDDKCYKCSDFRLNQCIDKKIDKLRMLKNELLAEQKNT